MTTEANWANWALSQLQLQLSYSYNSPLCSVIFPFIFSYFSVSLLILNFSIYSIDAFLLAVSKYGHSAGTMLQYTNFPIFQTHSCSLSIAGRSPRSLGVSSYVFLNISHALGFVHKHFTFSPSFTHYRLVMSIFIRFADLGRRTGDRLIPTRLAICRCSQFIHAYCIGRTAYVRLLFCILLFAGLIQA